MSTIGSNIAALKSLHNLRLNEDGFAKATERLSSGKVRVVKTYYKNDRYCRIFQSYIKLNGAKKHNTKHVCKDNGIWKF